MKRKRDCNSKSSQMKRSKKKDALILEYLDKKIEESINTKSKINNESEFSESDMKLNFSKDFNLNTNQEDNFYNSSISSNLSYKSEFDKNFVLSSLSGNIYSYNNENFEKIIKDYLNINEFPIEAKSKLTLLRKFISVYKRIKEDKEKMNCFLNKISLKLNENKNDIKVIF